MIKMIADGYLGTQTPYVYKKTNFTAAPKGYAPFYINHVARHGARYVTKTTAIEKVMELLTDAKAKGQITDAGEDLQHKLEMIVPIEKENQGLLTDYGKQMEQGIARRIYSRFPEVWGKKVVAVCDTVTRTQQTMEAFLTELGQNTDDSRFETYMYTNPDPILRFFDVNEEYLDYKKDGKWKTYYDEFKKRKDIAVDFLDRIFYHEFVETIDDKLSVVEAIYGMYCNQFDLNINLGLEEFFTKPELEYLFENGNVRQYLLKGPSLIGECLPSNIAFPLMMDFITTSQSAVDNRNISANLRFAHAETMMPYMTILRLVGLFKQTDDMSEVSKIWNTSQLCPMAANMQWIFYASENDDRVLVKILLNETEMRLPIESVSGPYYDWIELRQYLIDKINCLQLNWDLGLVQMTQQYTVNTCYV